MYYKNTKIVLVLMLVLISAAFMSCRKSTRGNISGGVWSKTNNLKVAILTFDSTVADAEAETFTEIFTIGMISTGKFVVVDRNQLDKIFKEQKLQLSGLTDPEKALQIGKLTGANKIVTGRISKLGKNYYLTVKGINAETGVVETGASAEERNIEKLINTTKNLASGM